MASGTRWLAERSPVDLAATALIAVQIGWWASIALPGRFRADDLFYIDAARDAALWDWIGRIYWEHFAPGHRLAFRLVGEASDTSWLALQSLAVAAFGVGLVCLYLSLRLLFGRSWWLLVPLAISGFAYQFALSFAWPSAGLQVIPEFAFGTLCMYAFLRHLHAGDWRWLAVSVAAFALGLTFYIRLLLIPVVLFLLRYLFLERDLSPRSLARAVWADRVQWLVFAFPAAVYISYFWQRHAFESPPPESWQQVADYVRFAWTRNVVPGFLGVRLGAWQTAVEVAGQVLVLALVAFSLLRKRTAALRAWGYVLLIVGMTFALTAAGKLGVVGAEGVAYDLRYVSNLCWLLPLGAVFALHPRSTLTLGRDWPSPPARRSAVIAGVASAVVIAVALSLPSARSIQQDWQQGGNGFVVPLSVR